MPLRLSRLLLVKNDKNKRKPGNEGSWLSHLDRCMFFLDAKLREAENIKD